MRIYTVIELQGLDIISVRNFSEERIAYAVAAQCAEENGATPIADADLGREAHGTLAWGDDVYSAQLIGLELDAAVPSQFTEEQANV